VDVAGKLSEIFPKFRVTDTLWRFRIRRRFHGGAFLDAF